MGYEFFQQFLQREHKNQVYNGVIANSIGSLLTLSSTHSYHQCFPVHASYTVFTFNFFWRFSLHITGL